MKSLTLKVPGGVIPDTKKKIQATLLKRLDGVIDDTIVNAHQERNF